MPTITPVISDRPSAYSSTRRSTESADTRSRSAGANAMQRVEAPVRQRDAERASGDREQHALDQQLTDDRQPPRAERRPDRHFAPARRGARKKQVGDVEAGDRQQHADRGIEDQQCG